MPEPKPPEWVVKAAQEIINQWCWMLSHIERPPKRNLDIDRREIVAAIIAKHAPDTGALEKALEKIAKGRSMFTPEEIARTALDVWRKSHA